MAAIAVAGVGLMVVCSSSVAAAMMMGGEEKEDPVVPKTPVVPTLPSGQYVKLVHTVMAEVINLAELEVFAKAGTTNLAAGKTVTSSAFHPAGPLPHLVDGNMTNFAHTMNEVADTGDSMLIDLGSVQEIEKIKITNRVDCCTKRAIGIKAVILGADGTTVIKETAAITTDSSTYTFTFPGTAWVAGPPPTHPHNN
jgi:hypothetical protein